MSDVGLTVRWTIGDVSPPGFDALRLSVWGAWRLFGPDARFVVCVNSVPLDAARALTGNVPDAVVWRAVTRTEMPAFLAAHFDEALAEGAGWKFMPLHLGADRFELALDNDCILWDVPHAIGAWLRHGTGACVIAADVRAGFGQFAGACGEHPRNAGIRGTPAGFDLAAALRAVLARVPVRIVSELDEQGLQVAAVSHRRPPLVVTLEEVAISSPFPPHLPGPGRCGVHFVGLNAKHLPWDYYGRPAVDCIREHWVRHREAVAAQVGIG